MTPQEHRLIDDLFDRLSGLENLPRDPDAERAIIDGLRRAPNAPYALIQTALVQDEALKRANARIEELEGRAPAQQPPSGGFLDSMRNEMFGQSHPHRSVPNVKPPAPGATRGAVWNSGQVLNSSDLDQGNRAYAPSGDPRANAGNSGGSFLSTAAAAAAGAIGGSLLMNSIRGLMGSGQQTFSDTSASDSRSPWGGDQSNSDLARDAGLNDIGKNGAEGGAGHQGFFDNASNDSSVSEDDGFDSSSIDGDDSNYT